MAQAIHYVKVTGRRYYSSLGFGYYTNNEKITFFTALLDSGFETLKEKTEKGETQYIGHFANVFDNGDYTLYSVIVKVESWRICEDDEIEHYAQVLRENNLEIRNVQVEHTDVWTKEVYYRENTLLCYIDKEKMPIMLNGEKITYKELKEKEFDKDDKILHTFDNGYSHWGEYTGAFDKVFEHIEETIFKKHNGMAHRNEYLGWNYNNKGALVIRITKQDRNVSYVSNT